MSVRTGMFPPPSVGPAASGMPGPMPPMGAAPNPFAPMPPMPLAGMPPPPPMGGMPPPPMAQAPMPQPSSAGLGSVAGSNAPRRRVFGDFLESKLRGGQARPAPQMPPQMMPQQQMVAPGTPAMRTPPMPSMMPRPMMYGGEVDIFGYADGGPVVQYYEGAGEVKRIDQIYDDLTPAQKLDVTNEQLRKMDDRTGRFGRDYFFTNPTKGFLNKEGLSTDHLGYSEDPNRFYDTSNIDDIYANLTMAQKINVTNPQLLMLATGEGRFDGSNFVSTAEESADSVVVDPVVIDPVVEDDVVVSQPVSTITGSDSGPGSAVGAGGNFGTGTYTAAPVDPSEVNPIDYSQFTGDVGNFSNTGENFSLYGPQINIPQSVSQYMTGPSGGLTTSYGPEMVATSPIGAIKLPARPVEIDIFDFLSTPTYGTMYSGISPIDTGGVDLYDYDGVSEMRMGGEATRLFGGSSVPRQTMIGDDPHMLAYINPEEAQLLKDLGGTGEPGPGGIPAYRPSDFAAERTGTGAYSSYSHPTDGDDDNKSNNTSAAVAAANKAAAESMLSAGVGNVGGDKVYSHPTDNDDDVDDVFGTGNIFTETSPGASTVDFGTGSDDDVDDTFGTGNIFTETTEGASTVDFGTGTGSSGSGGGVPSYTPPPVYVPPVYTDKRGKTYDSQAEADAANQAIDAFSAQLMSYGAGNEFFNRFADKVSKPYMPREDSDRAASQIYSTRVTPEMAADSYSGPDILGGIYSNIAGIGGSDLGTGDSGVTAQPIVDSDIDTSGQYGLDDSAIFSAVDVFNLDPEAKESALSQAVRADVGQDYTPTSAELAAQLAAQGLTNVTPGPLSVEDQVAPFEEAQRNLDLADIGSQLQNNEITEADINEMILAGADSRPADAGLGRGAGFKSLDQLKADISKVEGTGDDAGYNRLLDKGETGTFSGNKPLTEMTVAEAIKFGTSDAYRNYSRDVLGRGPNELPSTPMGKYQIVGNTLKDLVDRGLVDPNAQFDADTQEQIGSLLVKNRGYDDVLSGKITEEQFLSNLGNEFEGVKKDKNFNLSGGSVDQTGINRVSDGDTSAQDLAAKNKAIYDRGLGADDDPRRGNLSVNAAEAKYLQNLLSTLEFNDEGKLVDKDPNFIEDIFGKLVRNFTLGLVDINDLDKNKVQEVLDAYRDTGSFVYDTEGNAIDLKTVEDLERLEKLSAGEGQNPAVIGVRNEDGETVSFGSDIANTSEGPIEVDDDIFATIATSGDDDTTTTTTTTGVDTDYTTDENGNKICNQAGYVYDVATDACVPAVAEEESTDTSLNIGSGASRSFEDVLKNIQTKATTIAPISANIKPMAQGGMAGLNRTADNFLRALGG